MIPLSYFYLVDIETEQALAIFCAEECRSGNELAALEGRLRVEHNVDDVMSGLVLRASGSAPLSADAIRIVLVRQARRRRLRR